MRFTRLAHASDIAPAVAYGKPLIYISRGTEDNVPPIEHCSRRIAAQALKWFILAGRRQA